MHDIYRVCFDEDFVGVVLLAMTEKYKTILRGDFLKNRVFLAKSAQNLVTKPAGENPLTAIIFSNKFSKICENLKNFTGSLAT